METETKSKSESSSSAKESAPSAQLKKESKKPTTLKLLLLGDSGVGKTSLMHRLVGLPAPSAQEDTSGAPPPLVTIGIDFKTAEWLIGEQHVKVQIWDTPGQERFRTFHSSYYQGMDAIVYVYALDDASSYQHVTHWAADVARDAKDAGVSTTPKEFLVGNKIDCGVDATRELKMDLLTNHTFMVSAKTNQGVHAALATMVMTLLAARAEGTQATSPTHKAKESTGLLKTKTKRSSWCCW